MSLVFESKFDITKTINTKITVSDYEVGPNPALTHTPEKIINNDNFDGSRRWTVYGNNHFIDFEFDQQLTIHGLSIAWYSGNEYRYTFKITSRDASGILFNGVSTGTGSYETYKFKTPITTNHLRILCNGNLRDEWTRITTIRFQVESIVDSASIVAPFPDCPENMHWHEALQRCVNDHITEPPNIVIIDPVQTVKHGDKVMIDASRTTDPIGANLFYEWIQIAGELVRTGSKLQPSIMFVTPTIDTEIKFRLKVTNAGNISATQDATVVVRSAIPQCPPGSVWNESEKRCVDISTDHQTKTDPKLLAKTTTTAKKRKPKPKKEKQQ